MCQQRVKANEHEHRERGKILRKQLFNCINGDGMIIKIMRELIAIKETNEIASKQVLNGAKKVEVQRTQKAILDTTE